MIKMYDGIQSTSPSAINKINSFSFVGQWKIGQIVICWQYPAPVKSKSSNCPLVRRAVTAFWLCTTVLFCYHLLITPHLFLAHPITQFSPDAALQIPFCTKFSHLLVPNAGWGFAIGESVTLVDLHLNCTLSLCWPFKSLKRWNNCV